MKRLSAPVSAFFCIVFCLVFAANDASSSAVGFNDNLPPETRRELAQVRAATARYHNITHAIEDGYVDIDVFAPGQGFHYLKPAILDAQFEVDKPELLVYAVDGSTNRLRLVCIEYAVPVSLSATAPEGFTGDADEWHLNEDFGLWTLHCWAWHENPNGMFAEFSPRVP